MSELQENNENLSKDEKYDSKFNLKAGIFLTSVTGISAIIGFGATLSAVKKQDVKSFNKGMIGNLEMTEPAIYLALRALGWGTVYAVTSCGFLFYGIWKLSGAETLKEFRYKMGSILPRIPKNHPPQSRTEFSGMNDLLEYLSNSKDSNDDNETGASSSKINRQSNSDEINTNEDFLWLSLYTDPWSEVMNRWEKTYELRRTNVESYSTVNEFLNIWPILKDQRCETLINWDFTKLYPHKDINLFCNWKFFFETVKTLRKCSDDQLQENEHEDNEDILFLKQLIQLPSLLPPKGRIVKDKKHWKYSTLEVTDSIIVLAKTPGDISEALEKQNKLCAVRGITLQPFIIVKELRSTSQTTFI
ncbi:hypothetical protein FQR65_LT09423 [Abscondita terminalis]|nr:hypothetical protein FQR65_LT09423 [Abscondita terminalis]